MKEFLIGRYQIGWRMVNLYANPDSLGGWYNACLDSKEPQIHIGMANTDVYESVGVLTHEALEFLCDDHHVIFKPNNAYCGNASDVVTFHYDHNQHTEIAAKLGMFLFAVYSPFVKAHKKCHQKAKK